MAEQLANLLPSRSSAYELAVFALLLAAAAVGSRAVAWLWARIVRRLRSRSAAWAAGVAQATTSRVGLLAFLLLLQPALSRLERVAEIGSSDAYALIGDGVYVFTVLAVAVLAEALVRATMDWYLAEIAHRTQTTLDEEFLPLLKKLNIVIIVTLAATVILGHFDVELSGLLATAGIASLAVALAAQETLANMFAGLSLLLDKPFREGDRIELTDGTLGDVAEIGLRSTKILTRQNTVLIIPNKQLADGRIVNHVYPDRRLRVVTQLGVGYASDLRNVKRLLSMILAEQDGVLQNPQPRVDFVEFGDSALLLRVVFWIEDYRNRFAALDAFNMNVKDCFESEGIEIPFPQRTLHLWSAQPDDV